MKPWFTGVIAASILKATSRPCTLVHHEDELASKSTSEASKVPLPLMLILQIFHSIIHILWNHDKTGQSSDDRSRGETKQDVK